MERPKKKGKSNSSDEIPEEFLDELLVLLKRANQLLYREVKKI